MNRENKIVIYGAVGSLLGWAISEVLDTHPTITMLVCSTAGTIIGQKDQPKEPANKIPIN